MGDFNLDLLNTDSHSVTNEFINTLFSHMLYPLNSKPTRITSHSTTLVDKIFTNNISARVTMVTTDHLPIFTLSYTKAYSSSNKSKKRVGIRNFSSQNIYSFNNLLCEFDWNSLNHADANATYNGFL